MSDDPAYVEIANAMARDIRLGTLPRGSRLHSYPDLAAKFDVSQITIRHALELLQRQGLVRSERRKGVFVTDNPSLVRITPERQMQGPEETVRAETNKQVEVLRETRRVNTDEEISSMLAVEPGTEVIHVVTKVLDNRIPVSVSDTWHTLDLEDVPITTVATELEERVADRIPDAAHREWLQVPAGSLAKRVRQYYWVGSRVGMYSEIWYPLNRFDEWIYRIYLREGR